MTKTYAVPPQPFHNEGKTIAAWILTMGSVLGTVPVALGMILPMPVLIWVGIGMIAVAILAGVGLALAGFGQPRRTAEADSR